MAHPLQTSAWADLRKSQGHQPYWIGNCLMLVKQAPRPFKSIGVMSQVDLHELSFSSLKELAKQLNLSHVQIDPQNYTTDKAALVLLDQLEPKSKTESLVPRKTAIVDLTQEDSQLLAAMKKNWRYNIKLASEKGIRVVEESNDNGLEHFLKLYFHTVEKKQFLGRNPTYFRQVWEQMSHAGLAHIFVGYFGDTPVVARMIFTSEDTIYTLYTGTSRDHSELKGAYLMFWELIQWGKRSGYQYIDMWGADPDAKPGSRDYGYSQFKLGFGGQPTEYLPAYDLVISPVYYRLFKIGNALRLFVLRAKAKLR